MCDAEAVQLAVEKIAPDAVIHAAALTDVDACETRPADAERVNNGGTANVCEAAANSGAALVFISTDYVFDGKKGAPYLEDDPPAPVNEYGKSKLRAEETARRMHQAPLIARTSSPFGEGRDFVRFVLEEASRCSWLRVVSDWRSTPTYYADLAHALLQLIEKRASGIVHLSGAASCSRYEWACEIVKIKGLSCHIEPAPHTAFAFKAARPPDASLASGCLSALGLAPLRSWHEALRDYLAGLP